MKQPDLFPDTIATVDAKEDNVHKCRKCLQTLPLTHFNINTHNANNRDHRCKKCLSVYSAGLVKVRKTVLLSGKNYSKHCECCGRTETERRIVLDHCHETLRFRGWLCHACNAAIGQLGDDIDGVRKALLYLYRSEEDVDETHT